jgi:hypothetical protein
MIRVHPPATILTISNRSPGAKRPLGKFGGRDSLAVKFDDDAARKQLRVAQKLLDGAGQRRGQSSPRWR